MIRGGFIPPRFFVKKKQAKSFIKTRPDAMPDRSYRSFAPVYQHL